jgi:hypothetical protein
MKIVFDVDGVNRNLNSLLMKKYNLPNPTSWFNNEWDKLGYSIYDLVKKDNMVLKKSLPTKYFKTIYNYAKINGNQIEFWSHQPPSWRKLFKQWIYYYFKGLKIKICYLTPKQKLARLNKLSNYILVDDFPHFTNYKRIILIDYPYNQNVKNCVRIKTIKQLKEELNKWSIKKIL